MHPDIRRFPSDCFYGGRLTDSEAVASAPPESFHALWPLKPYMVFDVSGGQQERGGGRSLQNRVEARLAACLYAAFKRALAPGEAEGRVVMLTPYRSQLGALKDELRATCGDAALAEVIVSTVDGFQGSERDVVIFSCVRAGGTGVGFVADLRRMNVGLTRAKRALWVLGNRAALEAVDVWRQLFDDAQERQVLVRDADASKLFPDLVGAR